MSVIGIFGPTGTLKSSLAFSMPGKKCIFDLERGAHRASWRFPDTSQYDIWQSSVDNEAEKLKAKFMASMRIVQQGSREMYEEITNQFITVCMDPQYDIIVLDTAKELWEVNALGYLQELQEDTLELNKTKIENDQKEIRQQLGQIEYRTPNNRMRQFFSTARAFNKHLVVINHSRPVRKYMWNAAKNKSEVMIVPGEFEIDGFSNTEKLCDWVLETGSDEKDPRIKWAKIKKSAIGPSLEGTVLSQKVDAIIGYDYPMLENLVHKFDREVLST